MVRANVPFTLCGTGVDDLPSRLPVEQKTKVFRQSAATQLCADNWVGLVPFTSCPALVELVEQRHMETAGGVGCVVLVHQPPVIRVRLLEAPL